jgi:glycosyltransferase involved in cell wall biosynthesis
MSISVVVPTYNRADMIGRALESIFAQSFADIEVIVVDDGSTDQTSAVVRALAADHQRSVHYSFQENRGCAAARNRGIELATGEFIAFLDSDDEWSQGAIESMVATLEASGADFVYSPAVEVRKDGSEYINYPVAAGSPQTFAREHFISCNTKNGTVLFRTEAVTDVGGFDETLRHNEDSDMLQRLAIRHRAAYLAEPTLRMFHHSGSKSNNAVAIHRALVLSAERILSSYPEFAATLGELGRRRVNELRGLYVESLLAAGESGEAATVAASMNGQLSPVLRLAVRVRSSTPIRWARRWKNLTRRLPALAGPHRIDR